MLPPSLLSGKRTKVEHNNQIKMSKLLRGKKMERWNRAGAVADHKTQMTTQQRRRLGAKGLQPRRTSLEEEQTNGQKRPSHKTKGKECGSCDIRPQRWGFVPFHYLISHQLPPAPASKYKPGQRTKKNTKLFPFLFSPITALDLLPCTLLFFLSF